MSGGTITTLTSTDFPAVLALNNANAAATSALDLAGLTELVEQACYARGVGAGGDGFLIAMDQNAAYDSPNFLWFRQRHDRFLYIDRIVISARARGQGHARRLYEDLFACASRLGHTVVGCEVNSNPSNPVSDAFHSALGFEVVGSAVLQGPRAYAITSVRSDPARQVGRAPRSPREAHGPTNFCRWNTITGEFGL